jgi:non-specific serine/threonine protein kinase
MHVHNRAASARWAGARYCLLETVRQFGAEKLAEAGEADDVRTRHLQFYLALAECADPALRGPDQKRWVQRVNAEHDNLRVALAWSHGHAGGADNELRLAGALTWFWLLRGHWTEGRRWLEAALEREAQGRPPSIAKALHGPAFFAWRHNDIPKAQILGERGLALAKGLDDRESLIYLLIDLGITAIRRADLGGAEARFGETVSQARSKGDPWFEEMGSK